MKRKAESVNARLLVKQPVQPLDLFAGLSSYDEESAADRKYQADVKGSTKHCECLSFPLQITAVLMNSCFAGVVLRMTFFSAV